MSEAVPHFERKADEYAAHAEHRPEFEERFKLWVATIDDVAPAGGAGLTAVDLGCGPGHLTCHLAQRGFRTISIDASDRMLASTHKRLEQYGITSVDLRRHMLPLPAKVLDELAGQADVILMSSVIEYVEQDSVLLRQCAHLLRAGGHLLVSFPNRRSAYWRLQRRLKWTPLFASSASRYQHHQYDPKMVTYMARAADLQVQGITFFALPLQRFTERILPKHRPGLATLFLVDLQRPETSQSSEAIGR